MGFTGGGILLLINLAWLLSSAQFRLLCTTAARRLSEPALEVPRSGFPDPTETVAKARAGIDSRSSKNSVRKVRWIPLGRD